jgi:NAD(P)H-dependent flavin oxidoreductase YrpB (nitropropane dioxygenase family)
MTLSNLHVRVWIRRCPTVAAGGITKLQRLAAKGAVIEHTTGSMSHDRGCRKLGMVGIIVEGEL